MRHGICKASQSQQLRLELGPAGRLEIRMDAEMLRMDSISLTRRVSKTGPSSYGVMTGVRVRSAVDRSILGLSSRLPEVAGGFSCGGLIGSTHATQRVARWFTRPRPPYFQDKRSGARCRRGSSFRFCTARGRCRWCARARLPCRSFDHQIHARRGRAPSSASYWRPSAPH
jgi:hypothetical protein